MTDVAETAESSERMVLRTVYLPPELDEKLRVSAFRAKLSKGDVIRRAIARELDTDSSLINDTQTAKAKSTSKVTAPAKSQRAVSQVKAQGKTVAVGR